MGGMNMMGGMGGMGAMGGMNMMGGMGGMGAMAMGGKNGISKKIGWINKQYQLEKPIMFKDVSGPLNAMGEGPAMKLLEEFEQKSAGIKDPTKWIAAAAARMTMF